MLSVDGESRLLALASGPLASSPPTATWVTDVRSSELFELLEMRNGVYAFESALHVLPASRDALGMTLERWNAQGLWKAEFAGLADEAFCFAEDIFGVQFALSSGSVVIFDPETGSSEFLASTILEWAAEVVNRYRSLTGYPLAREWQAANGALLPGQRLLPKQPFVLGGAFEVANLYLCDSVAGMKVRGAFARQIADLPDGSIVQFESD